MQVVADALGHETLDPVKAAQWLHSHSVNTVMGKKTFDKKGDLTVSDYVMYKWDDKGKYHQLD